MTTRCPRPPRSPRSHRRRGYVMPTVLMVTLVLASVSAMMLSRASSITLSTQRRVDGYREHHGTRGLQATLRVWLTAQDARAIDERLGDFGHALDLELSDRSTISLFLTSGQGTALADLSSVEDAYRPEGAVLLRTLNELSPAEFDRLTRPVGPVGVDVNTAEEPVLRAACSAISLDRDKNERMLAELLAARLSNQTMTRQDLTRFGGLASLNADERSAMNRLLTAEPIIWSATIEVRRGPGSGDLTARYKGLVLLRAGGQRRQGVAPDLQSGAFLTWNAASLGPQDDPRRPDEGTN